MAPEPRAVRELGLLSSPASRPSVDQANSELKALQFRAVTDYNRLRDGVARLGSDADTVRARQQLSSFSQSFRDLAVEFKQKVASHPARDAASTQKLIRDFQTLLKGSEKLMSIAREREAASLPVAAAPPRGAQRDRAAAGASPAAATAAQEQKQALLATENALVFNEALIEERDAAVRAIGGQIGEVHQIFQDLAVLVSDQGAALDDIEANISRAAAHTGEANVQLVQAERSQRAARGSWCVLLAAAAAILLVLILIIAA
ncbi:SYP2 [Auxenochlorella protothecoides x Auxenochlorella symbiontica]|uniref:t-SNARE coiled-coil homology domain-containing protein n=1 Tax=Auxenochlorella protothecoides TaxID=3075 RepID=A0A1D1ZQ34_AUXPR